MIYQAVIPPYRESVGYPVWTPGMRNVRVPVGVSPQRSPDPIAQGSDTYSRRAFTQVATSYYDTNNSQEDRFRPIDVTWVHQAMGPRGRMTPWVERANIAPPQHVAYGSLFVYQPPVYGYH